MPNFTVQADVTAQVKALHNLQKTQLPFVLAKSLTNVAKEAQTAVKLNVRNAFKLRNNWTEAGIRVRPASKMGTDGKITADVHTDTANQATGAPDYLGRQEDGGEKVPYGGRQYLAIPTRYLRQMAPGIIPVELRPKNLLGATGGRYLAKRRGKAGALRQQKIVKGFEFFLQTMKDNDLAIMGRYFTDRDAYPFYLLIHEAHVKKSALNMQTTVSQVVNNRFQECWDTNWRDVELKGFRV